MTSPHIIEACRCLDSAQDFARRAGASFAEFYLARWSNGANSRHLLYLAGKLSRIAGLAESCQELEDLIRDIGGQDK